MISIVVPLYNEEESIAVLYTKLLDEVKKFNEEYEVIFIDDGSTDRSLKILKEIDKKDRNIKIYSFRKNQGKSDALTFGFQKAEGDYIITLDADLQDKPKEISKLLREMEKGKWDLVCGWRKERNDAIGKVFSSKLFNSIASVFWGLRLHDYNCGLKLYTKEAAKSLRLYGGMHRFIPLLAHQEGFRVSEVEVTHDKRRFGKSKYGLSKLWKDMPDIFTMLFLSKYSKRPLHFFGTVGGILLILGVFILGYLSALWFQGQSIGRRPLLFLGVLLVLSGFQVFFTGFLADLIINISQKQDKEFFLKYSSED